MIKKLNLGLLIAVLSLTVGVGFAHAEDVSFANDTTVNLSGPSINLVISAGSSATAPVEIDRLSASGELMLQESRLARGAFLPATNKRPRKRTGPFPFPLWGCLFGKRRARLCIYQEPRSEPISFLYLRDVSLRRSVLAPRENWMFEASKISTTPSGWVIRPKRSRPGI